MPLRQYPNRRTTVRRPDTLGSRLMARPAPQTSTRPGSSRPTIRGWQNYTGRTMGPVGQFSRVPGFGRSFRG